MTKLEFAFSEAAKLSPSEQDALAEVILQALASEKRWTEAFEHSQDKLEQLSESNAGSPSNAP